MEFAAGKLILSEQDFQRAIDEMPEHLRLRRVMRAYAVVVILAGLGGGLVQAALVLRGLWIGLGVALLVYAQFRSGSVSKKLFRAMNSGEREVSYRFDAEGVNVQTSVSDFSVRYAAIRRQREVSTAFLLYTQERVAQIIPKRAFDAAQLERIRQWLERGVPEGPPPKNVLRIFVIWTVLVVVFLLVWQLLVAPG